MLKPYQPNLREILQATNQNEGVVLNEHFADWEEHINSYLKNRGEHSALYTYTSAGDKELFQKAQEHVEQHRQTSESKNAVVIVHPFYLPLTDRSTLAGVDKFQQQCDAYLERLVHFLHWQKENADTRVILFETLHHYAAASSLLLERRLVDDVLFTHYDTGKLLQEQQNQQFGNKTLYVGGGYNDGCLLAALCDLIPLPPKEIYALKDLIIDPPSRMKESIHPEDIFWSYSRKFSKKHCLKTEQLKKRLRRTS